MLIAACRLLPSATEKLVQIKSLNIPPFSKKFHWFDQNFLSSPCTENLIVSIFAHKAQKELLQEFQYLFRIAQTNPNFFATISLTVKI
jgi:hypothetical protein